MDVVDPPTRSRMMSGIRDRDTTPELVVRKSLWQLGYRYRLHRRDLAGVPDIVLPRHRVAIFVHGCFWHRHAACKLAKLPATRPEFWRAKLQKNVERDRAAQVSLLRDGWRVLTVWECATRDRDAAKTLGSTIRNWIASGEAVGSISLGGE